MMFIIILFKIVKIWNKPKYPAEKMHGYIKYNINAHKIVVNQQK